MARSRTRILQYPFAISLQGALLDSYREAKRAGSSDVTLAVRALEGTSSELFERDGVVHERVQGVYVPAQLYFTGVSGIHGRENFQNISDLPTDDPAGIISDMLTWRQPGRQDTFFVFLMHQAENLMFFADQVSYERLAPESIPFTLERDWSPPPPMPGRFIPQPKRLHQRFGGDPITYYLSSRPVHQRLFIGGTDIQPEERPQVDIVFNVSESPSKWVKDQQTHPQDRWDNKGEGSEGMSLAVIHAEADWVIEHLKKGQRVLVHCTAGMNRSSTICCAALILLEGLTAEQALERVREHHPWARPDSRHWLKLRWLAQERRNLPVIK
jgi:hypothetical protein